MVNSAEKIEDGYCGFVGDSPLQQRATGASLVSRWQTSMSMFGHRSGVKTAVFVVLCGLACPYSVQTVIALGGEDITISAAESAHAHQEWLERVRDGAGDSFHHILVSQKGSKFIARAGDNGQTLRVSDRPHDIIHWSLTMADATVLGKGRYEFGTTLEIPKSNVALIIGKEATLVAPSDARLTTLSEGHGDYLALILNKNRNNVKVINLGTLVIAGNRGSALVFDGRNGGGIGIHRGLIFSAGSLQNKELWVVDAEEVEIPLICDKDYSNAVLAMEGCEDCGLGIIAGLAGSKARENETLDLNSFNERTTIGTLIGTAPAEQVLDINNSPHTQVAEVIGYGKSSRFPESLVDRPQYPPHGRRLTQKPYIDHSKGSVVKEEKHVDKNVTAWKRTIETPGFPDSLPVMKINASLTAVFEDGSEEQVFDKSYAFNLQRTDK